MFRRAFAAFTYRDFRVLWFGALASTIGTWMQKVAQSWLVFDLTNSSFYLGLDAFRIERSDLVGWLAQPLPVILIVSDASEDRAHWLHVQGHFAALPDFNLFAVGKRLTVHPTHGKSSTRGPSACSRACATGRGGPDGPARAP